MNYEIDECMVCGAEADGDKCPNGCDVGRCRTCGDLAALEDDGLCGECSYVIEHAFNPD